MPTNKKGKSKLQGVSRLITDATIGVTDIVESMHRRVVHPPFLPSTPIQHLITNIAGVAYKNIRRSTRFIGSGTERALGLFTSLNRNSKTTERKEAMSAVLNGVIGDHLEKTENPLAINMQFRNKGTHIPLTKQGIENSYPTNIGKIIVMVHGSCLNDIQWTRNHHNHGSSLASDLGKTPIYLHYNSGRHISTNGREFSEVLEELVLQWPVPVEEIIIVAHSMGGLVSRSAFYYGEQQKKIWTKSLKKMIFLGTPHHGAPLEQAGNYIDAILEAVPYAKPFARLGKIRSAGVTDLRYGNLVDEDWQNIDRFKVRRDKRMHIPLPNQIDCYTIAGVTGKKISAGSSQFSGDTMVGVKSALGQHKKLSKNLVFDESKTLIAYETNHLDLLSSPEVYNKIKIWAEE